MMSGDCVEETAMANNFFAQIWSQPLIRNIPVGEDELNLADSRFRRLKTPGVIAFSDAQSVVGRDKEIGCLGVAFGDAFVIRLFGKCVPTEYSPQGDLLGISKAVSGVG